MEISIGDVVSINTYYGSQPFKSVVIDRSKGSILLRLTKEFALQNYYEGDSLIINYEHSSDSFKYKCTIKDIMARSGVVRLSVDEVQMLSDKRCDKRFSVSLFAEIKNNESSKNLVAYVRNISVSGMAIDSKHEFDKGQVVNVDMFTDKSMMSFEAEIVWKTNAASNFRYGLKNINSSEVIMQATI